MKSISKCYLTIKEQNHIDRDTSYKIMFSNKITKRNITNANSKLIVYIIQIHFANLLIFAQNNIFQIIYQYNL